jgi:hypothetical protein
VLRNSYMHPRVHLSGYLKENGFAERSAKLWDEALAEMKDAAAPPFIMGGVLYNAAWTNASRGEVGEALDMLKRALEMRPDLKSQATGDPDMDPLRDDPRFQTLVRE